MLKLEQIGFYTLSDARAATATADTPLSRCELVLSARCNFRCPYCRSVGGPDVPFETARRWVETWAGQGLKAVRFSGGEPTLYPGLVALVAHARRLGIERIAISTNGSAPRDLYERLLAAGANDFSVSLDACCAEDAEKMMGVRGSLFDNVVENIRWLATQTYVTVGVVLTRENASRVADVITFASSLGVADVRVIPAAQDGETLPPVFVSDEILAKHPILAYRIENHNAGRPVRGLDQSSAPKRCGLVLDDVAACGDEHWPCIIYMREGGAPIGKLGPDLRKQRERWWKTHDVTRDPICAKNCLDVCVDYNRRHAVGCQEREEPSMALPGSSPDSRAFEEERW